MKVKFPGFDKYYSLLNMPGDNTSDSMVFLSNSGTPVIQMKIINKGAGRAIGGSGGFTANQWEEVTFHFNEENTKVFLNGSQIFSHDVSLSTTFADCHDALGYFVISGDEAGDDNDMYWADVKVYDGIVD